jgi:hypothetical protein
MFLLLTGAGQLRFGQGERNTGAGNRVVIDNLDVYYFTQDPHYRNAARELPNLLSTLSTLRSNVTTAQSMRPGQHEAEVADCLKAINTALRRVNGALQLSEELVAQYGDVEALLSSSSARDENRLARAIACVNELNAKLENDPAIAASVGRLDQIRQHMEDEFDQIDEAGAKKRAKSVLRRVVPEKEIKAGAAADSTPAGPVARNPAPGPCENINFEDAKFEVRDVRIDDPFDFLPWVRTRERRAYDQIVALVKGQPFRYDKAAVKALEIIETENFLPDTSDKRVKLRLEIVKVENCADGKLDLVYGVFSTQIMPVMSAAPESRVIERRLPQAAAGQTTAIPAYKPIHFIPMGGYDSTDLLYGGGRLELTPRQFSKFPFKSFIAEGQGSSRMHYVSSALEGSADYSEGSTDASKWLAHAEWRLNFTNYSLPTGVGQIKGGDLSAQFSGTTKPLGSGDFSFRFGGLLEGGYRQSDVSGVALSSDTLPAEGFGSLKLYVGLDSRLPHHVLSASYGLELGSLAPSKRIDWRKHVLDARHEFWYSIGDHRILDVESRLTFGSIQVAGKIPLSERFFGGNNEEFFIPGDDWQIRANPVIRAIPGNRFFRTANGAGSKSFVSYNLTAAYAVWRKTLVPQDLTADPDFGSELEGAITTVTNTLQNYYASKDPHYANVVTQLPRVRQELDSLKTTVAASQASHPGQSPELFKACTKAVSGAIRRMDSAITPQGADQFGLLTFLLSDDPDEIQLLKVTQVCATDLSTAVNDSDVATASNRVETSRRAITAEFNLIDEEAAARKAKAEMAFTRRTLKTLFNDVNIYSISPVVVLDVAKITPQQGGLGGARYGPGLGIRLELASVAHFTTGFAWNVRRGPGEGRGNVFFSIGIRDLFR